MRQFLIDYFVLLIVGAVVTGFAIAAYAVSPGESSLGAVLIYAALAVSVCVLAAGHVVLLYRERDEIAPFWLVSLTYALVAFAFALLNVVFVVGADYFFPGSLETWVVSFGYGALGASAGALLFAAVAFIVGMRTQIMRRPIFATPWHAAKHLIKELRKNH